MKKVLFSAATVLFLAAGCEEVDDLPVATDTGADPATEPNLSGCDLLCSEAEAATNNDSTCVANWFTDNGYVQELIEYPECSAIAGLEEGCLVCMTNLSASDADCEAAHAACF